jgi:hypothetical protein
VDACVSPIAVSGVYIDGNTHTRIQTHTGFFTAGILIRSELPKDAYGAKVSFRHPSQGKEAWDANTSRLIRPHKAEQFAAKVAIGSGEVQFGVYIVAPKGSPSCTTRPEVAYDHLGVTEYFKESGALPWRNPLNMFTNTLSKVA